MGRLAPVQNGKWARKADGTWGGNGDEEQPPKYKPSNLKHKRSNSQGCCKNGKCSARFWFAIIALVILIAGAAVGITIWKTWTTTKPSPESLSSCTSKKTMKQLREERIQYLKNHPKELDSITILSIDDYGTDFMGEGANITKKMKSWTSQEKKRIKEEHKKTSWGVAAEAKVEAETSAGIDKTYTSFSCSLKLNANYNQDNSNTEKEENKEANGDEIETTCQRVVPQNADWIHFTVRQISFDTSGCRNYNVGYDPRVIKTDDKYLKEHFALPNIFVAGEALFQKLAIRGIQSVPINTELEKVITENLNKVDTFSEKPEDFAEACSYDWKEYLRNNKFTISNSNGYISVSKSRCNYGGDKGGEDLLRYGLMDNAYYSIRKENQFWNIEYHGGKFKFVHVGFPGFVLYQRGTTDDSAPYGRNVGSQVDGDKDPPITWNNSGDNVENRFWKIELHANASSKNKFEIRVAGYWENEILFSTHLRDGALRTGEEGKWGVNNGDTRWSILDQDGKIFQLEHDLISQTAGSTKLENNLQQEI